MTASCPRVAMIPKAAILAGMAGLILCAGRAGGQERLNLFQLVSRAELVVHVKVRNGALKFAVVDVLEAIKGAPPASRLRVSFRESNWRRPSGAEAIVFPDGQEEILFLVPSKEVPRKERNADVRELLLGPEGRITLPAEGSGTIIEAMRRLAALTALDPTVQVDGLLTLLKVDNPYLLESVLDEIARLRVAEEALYPSLIDLVGKRSVALRRKGLLLMTQIFAASSGSRIEPMPDEARAALAAVLERARNDPDEQVRVEAVRALAAWPNRQEVGEDLRAIASGDPAQAVRYEAEKALFIKSRS